MNLNPYDAQSKDEAIQIGFFWLQRAENDRLEKKVFLDILLENNINPSMREVLSRINKKRDEENNRG